MRKSSSKMSERASQRFETAKMSVSSEGQLKNKIRKSTKINEKRRKMFSNVTLNSNESTLTDNIDEVVRNVKNKLIPSISSHSYVREDTKLITEPSWRGWIVVGSTRPIALLTSDSYVKKELKYQQDVDEDILSRLVQVSSGNARAEETSVSILAVKNLKVKLKHFDVTDLKAYGSQFHQGSGTSLFKDDITGLRKGRTAEVYSDIINKYDLPEVHVEEGSEASSTELRIFRATVTLKKPTCSLSDKSRERLFLMLSPSDDNVIDIMNNSQIKNKMLRHDIGKYLKPSKKKKFTSGKGLANKNAPIYVKRRIPSLVPVTEAGTLKNYPPLTTEIIFDRFFKEKEITNQDYTILVKEQPLLIENITLSLIPKDTILMTAEKKKTGFMPRYSFKDREGENEPESEHPPYVRPPKFKPKVQQVIQAELELTPEEREALLIESILGGTFSRIPDLKQNLDEHLNSLRANLKKKAEPETIPEPETIIEPEKMPEPEQLSETVEEEQVVKRLPKKQKKILSKWEKFELLGNKAEAAKELIDIKYALMSQRPENLPEKPPQSQFDKNVLMEEENNQPQQKNSVVGTEVENNEVAEELKEPSVTFRPGIEQILECVAENRDRLKKEIIVPAVKRELPKYHLTGRKRFYQTDMQQYWSEYHTDTNIFYHNPMERSGQKCGPAVINSDR